MGTVSLSCEGSTFLLKNCLYVLKLNCNLVSLLELFQNKVTITRKGDSFSLDSNNRSLLKGTITNNLLIVNYTNPTSFLTSTSDNLWHNRLGQRRDGPLKSIFLPINSLPCRICTINKAHVLPFKCHFDKVRLPLDCAHIDLVGPISPISVLGF
ncbi:hypothetical protein O181_113429 [Austropuccinia psidii MF-1]|uniref:Uncharacterized protein n=1 Tax=Austropuccinia psidii MF-1 TaxID=1389203 RepID=A0A9Q3K5V0_9BASI|nr:hypothetical protein [Austropuccinia psidii MF-1]